MPLAAVWTEFLNSLVVTWSQRISANPALNGPNWVLTNGVGDPFTGTTGVATGNANTTHTLLPGGFPGLLSTVNFAASPADVIGRDSGLPAPAFSGFPIT